MSRVRTVFFGSGGFGVEALWRLEDHEDIELVGVVTAPPRPAGRKGEPKSTEIASTAAELGVGTILTPERLRAPDAVASVLALEPQLAVLADYGQIVPGPILDLPLGALNLHPSLLPRHRGATPIPATILAGDRETGVTLFRMDEGLDSGPIIAQTRRPLEGTETAAILEELLLVDADALVRDQLGPWVRGEIEARPQPAEGATMTRPLHRQDGRLDAARPAVQLERQVRAYQPWPGSYLDTDRGRLIVHAASVGEPAPGDIPGAIVRDGDGLALATADGRLRLRRVQPAGGRSMPIADYLRGVRTPPTRLLDEGP